MPYYSASDLVTILPAIGTVTGSSNPITIGEVASAVERVSAQLDGAAARAGYSVPIPSTATTAWRQMEQHTIEGAGCFVLRSFFPNIGGPGDNTSLSGEYCQAFRDALAAIGDGTEVLIGAPEDTTEGARLLARSFSTSKSSASEAYRMASPVIDLGGYF